MLHQTIKNWKCGIWNDLLSSKIRSSSEKYMFSMVVNHGVNNRSNEETALPKLSPALFLIECPTKRASSSFGLWVRLDQLIHSFLSDCKLLECVLPNTLKMCFLESWSAFTSTWQLPRDRQRWIICTKWKTNPSLLVYMEVCAPIISAMTQL